MTGLLDRRDGAGVGKLGRAVDLEHLAVRGGHAIEDAGRGRDQVHVELALEPLLHDLHVQEPEESAAEPETQRGGRLGLEEERRVVQPQLLERLAQVRVLVALDRVEPGEHHRLRLLEAGQRLLRGARCPGHRVADPRIPDVLHVGDEKADLADAELVDGLRLGCEDAHLLDLVVLPRRHQPHLHARSNRTVHHADQDDDATVGVVPGVEDQRLERAVRIAGRRRQPVDDRLQDLERTAPLLRAGEQRVRRIETDEVLDLHRRLFRAGARQVDLVDDRHDLQVVVDRQVGVGDRLRLDPLRRVHQQQRAFAGGQRAGHLVGEVDVPRRVDEVQDVGLAVVRGIGETDRMGLYRDPPLPLQVHRIENLRLHLARPQRTRDLQEAIGERRLPVIDMGDDGEVADLTVMHLAVRGEPPRSTESGEAPARQGATREHVGHIRPRSNAVHAGCIAARMQRGLGHGLPARSAVPSIIEGRRGGGGPARGPRPAGLRGIPRAVTRRERPSSF